MGIAVVIAPLAPTILAEFPAAEELVVDRNLIQEMIPIMDEIQMYHLRWANTLYNHTKKPEIHEEMVKKYGQDRDIVSYMKMLKA